MKKIILFSSIAIASGLLFTNIYNSIIDAKSWGSNIPESIGTARLYYKSVNPGNFFRIFSPANQVLGLLSLIAFWKSSPRTRLCLGIALFLYVSGDLFTFAYFYPRNEIMFKTAQLTDVESLGKAWEQWSTMNWLRSLIIFTGLLFSFCALHRIYSVIQKPGFKKDL